MGLKGVTALVTGSTDGVGRLVARRLAQEGIHVIVHGRDTDTGRQVVQADQRGSAVFMSADFSSLDEVSRLAENVTTNCERLVAAPAHGEHLMDIAMHSADVRFAGRAKWGTWPQQK
jgi:NAD(P)-dependent dehydrogenase (short-subunit alcohol dehydrogenase family)